MILKASIALCAVFASACAFIGIGIGLMPVTAFIGILLACIALIWLATGDME